MILLSGRFVLCAFVLIKNENQFNPISIGLVTILFLQVHQALNCNVMLQITLRNNF